MSSLVQSAVSPVLRRAAILGAKSLPMWVAPNNTICGLYSSMASVMTLA